MKVKKVHLAAAVLAGAAAMALSAPTMASGETANSLLLLISNHIDSLDRATSDASRVDEARAAKMKIYRLRTEFPDDPAAFKLATGQAIGTVSLSRIEEILKGPFNCNEGSDPLSFDCALKNAEQGIREVEALSSLDYSLEPKADLAIGLATVRDFDRALEVLGTLAPTGEDAPHWSYVKASSAIACELARAGYGTESERLLTTLSNMKIGIFNPGYAKEWVAVAHACSGNVDRAIAVAKEIAEDYDRDSRDSREYCGPPGYPGGEHFIRTVAAIADVLLEDGDAAAAMAILDDHTQVLLNVDRRTCPWPRATSRVVETYARIGGALAEDGSPVKATRAYDRGLAAAAGSSPEGVWSDIGVAAVENRSSRIDNLAWPADRARDAVKDLLTVALSMHRSGLDTLEAKAAELLEAAQRAAGEEPGPATQVAAALAAMQGEEAGRRAFDKAVALTRKNDNAHAYAACVSNPYEEHCNFSAPARLACAQTDDVAAEALFHWAIGDHGQAMAVILCHDGPIMASQPVKYSPSGLGLIEIAERQIEAGLDWNANTMLTAVDIATAIVDHNLRVEVLIEIAERQIEAGLDWNAKTMLAAAAKIADELIVSATDPSNAFMGDEKRWAGPLHYAKIALVLARRH